MGDIPKQIAGYQHTEGTQYECEDCGSWVPEPSNRCVYMGREDEILEQDSCSYFAKAPRGTFGFTPLSLLSKEQAGWVRNPVDVGYSCKRCEEWSPTGWDCEKVDKDSEGDDPGMIHPDACCNAWKPDPERSRWSIADFYEWSQP